MYTLVVALVNSMNENHCLTTAKWNRESFVFSISSPKRNRLLDTCDKISVKWCVNPLLCHCVLLRKRHKTILTRRYGADKRCFQWIADVFILSRVLPNIFKRCYLFLAYVSKIRILIQILLSLCSTLCKKGGDLLPITWERRHFLFVCCLSRVARDALRSLRFSAENLSRWT